MNSRKTFQAIIRANTPRLQSVTRRFLAGAGDVKDVRFDLYAAKQTNLDSSTSLSSRIPHYEPLLYLDIRRAFYISELLSMTILHKDTSALILL